MCRAMSRTPAKVTQADIARCIRAAKQAGAAGVEIRPDGTIEIKLRQDEVVHRDKAVSNSGGLANWDDVLSGEWTAPPAKTKPRRPADRIGSGQQNNSDPLAAAYERFERGEISLSQLPPGKYPNGMRVYADGEWEAIVRSRPLGKLERAGLGAYFEADGRPGFMGGIATSEKLEVRGFIEIANPARDGHVPDYRITLAGKEAWLALSRTSGNQAKD
jgi:hypothetical protein